MRPHKPALFNWQRRAAHPEMDERPELRDWHGQLIVRLSRQLLRPRNLRKYVQSSTQAEGALHRKMCRPSQTDLSRASIACWKPWASMFWKLLPDKGEAKPRLAYCLWTPAAQLSTVGLCRVSAMMSRRMSLCKLLSDMLASLLVKTKTWDH